MVSSQISPDNVEWVSRRTLQNLFNKERIVERAESGEINRSLWNHNTHLTSRQRAKMNHAQRTHVRMTKCTRSQMILFATHDGKPLAIAHQYKQRDGELAGSGRVNPHYMFLDNGKVLGITADHNE